MDNLTVVIPFFNGNATIERLLDSLPGDLRVIVVDDQSDTPLRLSRDNVTVVRPAQKGYFAGACNAGMSAARGDVLILNQDSHFDNSAWVEWLHAKSTHYDIVGDGVFGHPAWPAGYVQGTFMFISRNAIERVGLFDHVNYPLWGCTCEYQLRACRAGMYANPVKEIPGFNHHRGRTERYGTAITEILKRQPEGKDLFIRTPPAVSVIASCYNYGRYLPDLIASLVGGPSSLGQQPGQTMPSFEVVICDDGSTDDTWEIMQSLADDTKGIHFVRHERNLGTPAGQNTAIRASYGRAIAVIGADDMMRPERLATMYAAWQTDPCAVVYDDITIFAHGKEINSWTMQEYDYKKLIYKNQMHAGIMFSRAAFEEVGGYPEIMREGREDWAINVGLGRLGYCGVHVRQPMYLYRREMQNRTKRNAGRDWAAYFLEQVQSLYPDVYLKGDSIMGCGNCGGGRRSSSGAQPVSAVRASSANVPMAGKDGFIIIEYIGGNDGEVPYYGEESGKRYVFSKHKKYQLVDVRDKNYFLNIIENRKCQFVAIDKMPAPDKAPAASVLTTDAMIKDKAVAPGTPAIASGVPDVAPDPSSVEMEGPDAAVTETESTQKKASNVRRKPAR